MLAQKNAEALKYLLEWDDTANLCYFPTQMNIFFS